MALFGKKSKDHTESSPGPDIPVELSAGAESPHNEEEALLSQYFDGDMAATLVDKQPSDEAEPAGAVDGDAEGEDGDPDDLMSIFTSEEEQDEDLAAMTRDLEDVDAASLLTQLRDISAQLQSRVRPG